MCELACRVEFLTVGSIFNIIGIIKKVDREVYGERFIFVVRENT